MNDYLRNRWMQVGLGIATVGWGPLLLIIVLDRLGLLSDPNPNPIGPGILFFLTFWPAVICMAIGAVLVSRRRARGEIAPPPVEEQGSWETRPIHTVLRGVAGLVGVLLVANGIAGIAMRTDVRGGAAALVVGVVAVHWCYTGRTPSWWGSRQGGSA